ncbi:MAG: glycosyltransferase family 39 protein [Betaproteobacteria bacterium]|nr:glycosyltransferase family 39 protein [Betaproteobacteria bacterium]
MSFAPTTVLPGPAAIAPRTARWPLAPARAWAVAWVGLWVAFAYGVNTAQFGDNVEQFNWAHSLEWGYYKHPPLPTWLLGGLIRLMGETPAQSYALAFACLAATALLTHDIARRLLSPRMANVALVLWGLQMPFSWRAQLYNHNTLLVLSVALTVWCVLLALRHASLALWCAAGLAGALAMLSKYQAVVPLAGIAVALAGAGELQHAAVRRGALLAVAVAAVALTPHALWLVAHDGQPLHYAFSHDQQLGGMARCGSVLGFTLNQLRFLLPVLLCIALAVVLSPRAGGAAVPSQEAPHPALRAWLFGLIGVPLLAVLALGAVRGVALQNHWGVQALQFVSLWLAWRLSSKPLAVRTLVGVALCLQLLGMVLYLYGPRARHARADLRFPTAALLQQVNRAWQARTACPLHYVAGNAFAAGLYATYAGSYPQVLEDNDPLKSPWVDLARLRSDGAVYFAFDKAHLPADVQDIGSLAAPPSRRRPLPTLYWGLRLPDHACAA